MRQTPIILALLATVASNAYCAVAVQQAADRSVTIVTPVYTAAIDAKGNLAELSVKGAKSITHQLGDPGKPPVAAPSINVIGQMVAVRSGDARVEWTFGEDTVGILTEGYNFECTLDAGVKSVIGPGGAGGPPGKYIGGALAVILANDLTVASTKGAMHVHERRYLPAAYTSGGSRPGDRLELEVRLGVPASAAQFLGTIAVAAVGSNFAELLEGGNLGGGFPHFPKGVPVVFTSAQENLGNQPFELEYRLSVMDHYVAAREVASQRQAMAIEARGQKQATWSLPPLEPGFYYLAIGAWQGEAKLSETRQTFTVDLPRYARPLTRPADWDAFWARQETRLAETPPNARVVEIGTPNPAVKVYEVKLDMPGGRTLFGCLLVPSQPKGPAGFGSLVADRLRADIVAKARDGSLKLPAGVQFTIALPGDATYTHWASAEDNNLLDCVLWYLRGIDFLASRTEAKPDRILVSGASRSGPLAVIAAARRPQNMCGVSGFVHTSAGISWTDKPYQSWGMPGHHNPADPEHVRRWAAMAAYVDPVNHAPDVTCPIWFGWGLDDGLSQPQGIEAMYRHTASQWKRISRDAGGHQYSAGMQKLDAELRALLESGDALNQSSTLRDH